ncbi:MAG: TIGR03943 family protein [Chthoniobacterales bacterium]|nr:TIGR03943 family protein [Chthoniobacterales bacterium]
MNKRILTLLTLVLWGALMLWFWGSGRIVSYLHPQFHPLVAATGAVLLLLAPAWWWATRAAEAGCAGCGCHHEHDAGERSAMSVGAIFAFAVLLLPVSAAALVSPSQFGEAAVMNRGMVTRLSQLPAAAAPDDNFESAPVLGEDEEIPEVAPWPAGQEEGVEYFTRGPDGSIQLETVDLLFAAEEQAMREEFENQRVSVVGQYFPRREGGSGGFDLVRMLMVCCAADARPVGIRVASPQAPGVARMGWIRVTGTARFVMVDGLLQPRLEAETIEEVPAPHETVLY